MADLKNNLQRELAIVTLLIRKTREGAIRWQVSANHWTATHNGHNYDVNSNIYSLWIDSVGVTSAGCVSDLARVIESQLLDLDAVLESLEATS